MHTRQDLEEMNIIHLAALCGKVAEANPTNDHTAEKANQFKWEWARLVASEPALDFKEQNRIEDEKQALKKRMVDFLERVQPA